MTEPVKFRAWGPTSADDPMGKAHYDNPQPLWVRGELVGPNRVQVGDTIHETSVGDEPGQYRPLRSVSRTRRQALRMLAQTFAALPGPEARAAALALEAVLMNNADRDSAAVDLLQGIQQVADSRKPMLGVALAVVLLADKVTTLDDE